jgi:hypothetical protein
MIAICKSCIPPGTKIDLKANASHLHLYPFDPHAAVNLYLREDSPIFKCIHEFQIKYLLGNHWLLTKMCEIYWLPMTQWLEKDSETLLKYFFFPYRLQISIKIAHVNILTEKQPIIIESHCVSWRKDKVGTNIHKRRAP